MTATLARRPAGRRGGYTLVELLVVNVLMALLVVLLGGTWRAFGPLCVEVIARGRVVNEANVAAQAIYQESARPPAGLVLYQVEAVEAASGWPALQFDYGPAGYTPPGGSNPQPWPYVVQYTYEPTVNDQNASGAVVNSDGRLVRYVGDPSVGLSRSIAVARHVESVVALALAPVGSEVSRVGLTVTFACRGSRGQYTFEVHH